MTFLLQVIFPDSGSILRVRMFMKVDLPSPFAPTRATCSPFKRRKETSEKMMRPPKLCDSFSTVKMLMVLFCHMVWALSVGMIRYCSRCRQ